MYLFGFKQLYQYLQSEGTLAEATSKASGATSDLIPNDGFLAHIRSCARHRCGFTIAGGHELLDGLFDPCKRLHLSKGPARKRAIFHAYVDNHSTLSPHSFKFSGGPMSKQMQRRVQNQPKSAAPQSVNRKTKGKHTKTFKIEKDVFQSFIFGNQQEYLNRSTVQTSQRQNLAWDRFGLPTA